jgi:hypothetical protein
VLMGHVDRRSPERRAARPDSPTASDAPQ